MVADEGEKGVDESQGATRVKRRRVLHFTSDDDGATANKEHLSAAVVNLSLDCFFKCIN